MFAPKSIKQGESKWREPSWIASDFLLILGWALSVLAREKFIVPSGGLSQLGSIRGDLHWIDSLLVHSTNWTKELDAASDAGQAALGIIAVLGPALINPDQKTRVWRAGTQASILLIRAAAMNGIALEWVRIAVQRPRPYVAALIENSSRQLAASDFTSFYSGHTSFCFTALTALTFSLRSKDASKPNRFRALTSPSTLLITLSLALSSATGVLRVLAGRHHLSDVLMGAIMGVVAGTLAFKTSGASKQNG